MKEEWLMPSAVVPVDSKTTAALVNEVKRLIGVVGSMALNQQRTWVGLTDEEMRECAQAMDAEPLAEGWTELIKLARAIEAKLKEKNNA